MTARPQDVALLPLPDRLEKIASYTEALNFTKIHSSGGGKPDSITRVPESIREAAAALASAQAREEELRAEVDRLQGYVREADRRVGEQFMAAQEADAHRLRTQMERLSDIKRGDEAEARAERLEEALRAARQKVYMGELPHGWTIDRIDAALTPNAAQPGETT